MGQTKKESISSAEVFAEVGKYSPSQRREFIEELEIDIQNLARSMENLYNEHPGVFIMYGVQIEVKFSVFNDSVYEHLLGCPEFFNQVSAMTKELKEALNDERTKTGN